MRICIAMCVLAAACGGKKDDGAEKTAIVQKARAGLERRFDQLAKLATGAPPAIDQDKLDYTGAALSDGGPAIDRSRATVVMIPRNVEALRKLARGDHAENDFVFDGSCDTCLLSTIGTYLERAGANEPIVDEPAVIEKNIRAFLDLEYVLLVTSTATAPSVHKDGFAPGKVDGEVRLYKLPDTYLGGFRFAAQSSDEVQFRKSKISSDEEQSVRKDLSRNTRKVLHDAIARQLRDSQVAATSE